MIDSKTFSGFGASKDPTERLRALVASQYKFDKHKNKNSNSKIIKGGVFPLAAVAAPALGALLGKILVDAYGAIKSKFTGKGYNLDHKTNNDKIHFVKSLIKEF